MIEYKCRGGFVPVNFNSLAPFFLRRSLFIVLDRDGTLAPFCTTPQEAKVAASTRLLLAQVLDHDIAKVAVVSARSLKFLRSDFDGSKFILAGNYGMEIRFPSGKTIVHPAARKAKSEMEEIYRQMSGLFVEYPQLILENHEYSLCLHFHRLPVGLHEVVFRAVLGFQLQFPSLRVRRLSTSCEVLPDCDWHKGKALDQIEQELSLQSDELLYLAFGDSVSDEAMYAWVNSRHGLSFNVGERLSIRALGRVDTVRDIEDILGRLLELKTGMSSSVLQCLRSHCSGISNERRQSLENPLSGKSL